MVPAPMFPEPVRRCLIFLLGLAMFGLRSDLALALSAKDYQGQCRIEYNEWKKHGGFGAAALGSNGHCGFTWDYGDRKDARDSALSWCRRGGKGKNCVIVEENGSLSEQGRLWRECEGGGKLVACERLVGMKDLGQMGRAAAFNGTGNAFARLGETNKAVDAFTQAIKVDKKYGWGYMNRGLLLRDKGKLEDAVKDFEKALSLYNFDPDDYRLNARKSIAEAQKVLSSMRGLENKSLCGSALASGMKRFEGRGHYVPYVNEAQRRRLSVGDCRLALGFAAEPNPYELVSDKTVCVAATIADSLDWNSSPSGILAQAEIKRRGGGHDWCASRLGLTSVAAAPSAPAEPAPPAPPALGISENPNPYESLDNDKLCFAALDKFRKGWNTSGEGILAQGEVKRRGHALEWCVASMERLVAALAPPATVEAVPPKIQAAPEPPPAPQRKRIALVIGNGAYEHVTGLTNPTRDAAAVAETLRRIGFSVMELENLGKTSFEEALANFSEQAAGADFAIFYYAGHGMEVDRQNYLIPVDAKLETDRRLRFETLSLDDVLSTLDGVHGIRMVLLDACRDNPFSSIMKKTTANRSIGRGLSRVEAADGTVISFSAKEGSVALDGNGDHSPFTAALLKHMADPGLEIQFLMRTVRDDVRAATKGEQEPYISASLPRQAIYLVPPETNASGTTGGSWISSPTPLTLSEDTVAADFQLTREINTSDAWKAFLAKHGGVTANFYVDLAKAAQKKLALTASVLPKFEPAVEPLPLPTVAVPPTKSPSPGGEARKIVLAELSGEVDPEIRKAVGALERYELTFGYFHDHLYIAVLSWGINWDMARRAAQAAGGHLVTISSSAENTFVRDLYAKDNRFQFLNGQRSAFLGPYIGLYQMPNAKEPNDGWHWVNDEPLKFMAWSSGQPDNYNGVEGVAAFITQVNGGTEPNWNDMPSADVRGFIVEVEPSGPGAD